MFQVYIWVEWDEPSFLYSLSFLNNLWWNIVHNYDLLSMEMTINIFNGNKFLSLGKIESWNILFTYVFCFLISTDVTDSEVENIFYIEFLILFLK